MDSSRVGVSASRPRAMTSCVVNWSRYLESTVSVVPSSVLVDSVMWNTTPSGRPKTFFTWML